MQKKNHQRRFPLCVKPQKPTKKILIGIGSLCLLMCLLSCKSDITVIEPVKPDCINTIHVNGDLLECLARYDEM